MPRAIIPERLESFMLAYAPTLTKVVAEDLQKPKQLQQYGYPVSQVPGVVFAMRRAIAEGT